VTAIKAPNPGIRVTVEKFFGSTRILAATIDIRCADAKQVDHLGDLLIGQAQTEKRTVEAVKPVGSANAGD
jgi:hypothetical protein